MIPGCRLQGHAQGHASDRRGHLLPLIKIPRVLSFSSCPLFPFFFGLCFSLLCFTNAGPERQGSPPLLTRLGGRHRKLWLLAGDGSPLLPCYNYIIQAERLHLKCDTPSVVPKPACAMSQAVQHRVRHGMRRRKDAWAADGNHRAEPQINRSCMYPYGRLQSVTTRYGLQIGDFTIWWAVSVQSTEYTESSLIKPFSTDRYQ
ncbi:hypothetical protein IF2G_07411 [Cordyceps javanica]|nr:hypothetical protein IF2G_07411 [Cordyceps javanica]